MHYLLSILIIITSYINSVSCDNTNSPSDAKCLAIGTYQLTFRPDSSSEKFRVENYKLFIGKNWSKFQSQSARSRDSLMSIVGSIPPTQRTSDNINFYTKQILFLPKCSFRSIIIKYYVTNGLVFYDWVGSNFYSYNEPEQVFNWSITSEKASIGGYKCQKATTSFAGRKYEAWFTREVPISDGPYKFHGLPGLIVKIGDTHQQYVFELTRLTKPNTSAIISLPTKKAQPGTRLELLHAQAVYSMGLADRVTSMGNSISAEDQQRMKRQNPLELR